MIKDYRVGLLRRQTTEQQFGPVALHKNNVRTEKTKLSQSGIIGRDMKTKRIPNGLQTEIKYDGIKRIVKTFRDRTKFITEER